MVLGLALAAYAARSTPNLNKGAEQFVAVEPAPEEPVPGERGVTREQSAVLGYSVTMYPAS